MANINDYLLWRGDIPINSKFKFNEIDSMILARFSYLRFDMIKLESVETIKSISEKMKDIVNDDFRYNGDKEMITYLGESERFKDMLVTDFVEVDDKDTEKQFSAVTVHINDNELYVSFIGTDASLIGWKEDFNMSFLENVPCQIAGKEYLSMIAEKYNKAKIRIGGHSKGGNVAIFSAISANEKLQNQIIKVYNYDGPGFNKSIIEKYGNKAILDKLETYLPQDSVIGRILDHKEKTTVVLSLEKGLYQHDIFSWQVLQTDLVRLERNTQISEDIKETLDSWLTSTTNMQRKIFIDSVFELFYSTEANSFGDMTTTLMSNIIKILKKYKEISKEDKKIMGEMISIFVKAYFAVLKEKESKVFNFGKKHEIVVEDTLPEGERKYKEVINNGV